MNKFTIPAILVATVMVAGMFAFMPVEQASTVHTSGTITVAAGVGISSTTIFFDGIQISHDAGGNADVDPDEIIMLFDGFGKSATATIEINTNLEKLGLMTDAETDDLLVMEELKSGTWSAVAFSVQGTLDSDHADVDNVQALRLRIHDDGAGTATITFNDDAYVNLTFIGP